MICNRTGFAIIQGACLPITRCSNAHLACPKKAYHLHVPFRHASGFVQLPYSGLRYARWALRHGMAFRYRSLGAMWDIFPRSLAASRPLRHSDVTGHMSPSGGESILCELLADRRSKVRVFFRDNSSHNGNQSRLQALGTKISLLPGTRGGGKNSKQRRRRREKVTPSRKVIRKRHRATRCLPRILACDNLGRGRTSGCWQWRSALAGASQPNS